MSQKELDRYEIIQKSIRRELTVPKAAELLYLSERQIFTLKAKVKEKGAAGLLHGNRGKPSNRRVPEKERQSIIRIIRNKYPDFGPTLASEKLAEIHGISHDPGTIQTIMEQEGLWKPKKRRKVIYRASRAPKDHYGEMEQFDGSYHDWFEGRAPSCCLLAAIDDATGTVPYASFTTDEGTLPVFRFWNAYFLKHGKPRTIYLDKLRTYFNNILPEYDEEALTQFQRAMEQLGVAPITAHSPQAKGRVERLFKTLQDRLVKELRLRGISDIQEANRFLQEEFLPWFNARYGREPSRKTNLHRKLIVQERMGLPSILSRHSERSVRGDFTLRFKNTWYQLEKKQAALVLPKDVVILEERMDGTLCISIRGKYLHYQVLPARPWERAKLSSAHSARIRSEKKTSGRKPYKPAADHPWRRSFTFQKPEVSISFKT